MAKKRGGQPTHGASKTPEYRAWAHMRQRCGNPKNVRYGRYGGRGIKVCHRWQQFEFFLNDMGERPTAHHSIDRKNNDGDYEPSNCRWATRSQQQKNRGIYNPENFLIEGAHWTKNNPEKARSVARENIKKAHKKGSENGRARLDEEKVRSILARIELGESDVSISHDFGVRPGTIWFIRSGKHWAHIR